MPDLILLYDGWPLAAEQNSPASLHLLALLEAVPPQAKALLALPAAAPAWFECERCEIIRHPTRLTPAGHLYWMQWTLPGLARKVHADLVFISGEVASLSSQVPLAVSPAGFNLVRPSGIPGVYHGLVDHFAASMGWAGLFRAQAILWPADLSAPDNLESARKLMPFVHPAFKPDVANVAAQLLDLPDMPDTYVLYHGPCDSQALKKLLDAWSWASGSIGEYYPLLVAGVAEADRPAIQALLAEAKQTQAVRLLPQLSPAQLAAVYQCCTAFFHTATFSPWGDPVRHALACGRPVVAASYPLADRLVGSAAYLASPQEPRALGAALISVIVEEELAERLAQAALQRAADWLKTTPAQSLSAAIPELA